MWKNEKFSLTIEIFRQINSSLVIHLIKQSISRNFCQKCMRENFRNFHSVTSELFVFPHVKFSLTEMFFREISSLAKTLLSRNFCQKLVRVNFSNFHSVHSQSHSVEICKFLSHARKFSVKPKLEIFPDS